MPGQVEVIIGSMFSGKTSELLRRVRRAEIAGLNVLLFKPARDTRYSNTDVVSHDSVSRTSITISDLEDILHYFSEYEGEVIGFDEAQFFPPDLVHYVELLANEHDRRVIVAGLDTDFRALPFETMVPLVFAADELTKLRAICVQCGSEASRTQRVVNGQPVIEGAQVEVGGTEAYEARCRSCFVYGGKRVRA